MELEIRRFSRLGNGSDVISRGTTMGSQAIAAVEPDNTECSRAGRRFHGGCQIITNGIAPVQAIPTTTATLALYNAELASGRSLCIDRIGFFLGSGTPAAGATLMCTISPGSIASPPAASGTGYGSASSSGSSNQTKARWTTAMTLPSSPVAPAWFPLISTQQLAAANVGQGDGIYEGKGGLVVPPGYALGFAIVSGAGTTPLYAIGARWVELELDLE